MIFKASTRQATVEESFLGAAENLKLTHLDRDIVPQETGKFMFSLEANNLVDENGDSKQTSMPYFESGWVDEDEEQRKKEQGSFKFPWQK